MAPNWPVIGLILAAELLVFVGCAFIVRYVSKKGPRGQTVWFVLVGVALVVAIASPVLGLELTGFLAACFSAAGLPMIIEYVSRVAGEEQKARDVMESSLDVHPGADR